MHVAFRLTSNIFTILRYILVFMFYFQAYSLRRKDCIIFDLNIHQQIDSVEKTDTQLSSRRQR